MVYRHLKYAKDNNFPLEIESAMGKKFEIIVSSIDPEMIHYKYSDSGNEGKIRLENIRNCRFRNKANEKGFHYRLISNQYNKNDMEMIVENYRDYYDEILQKLQMRERIGTFKYKYLDYKKSIFKMMFENLHLYKDSLLLYYFAQKLPKPNGIEVNVKYSEKDFLVLLQSANLSQKQSIKTALENKISIIEGPPGTGKTTTILSIIANLICMSKKVVVVSKNNPAIDNVAEELQKMGLPEFFIRFGNNEIMGALSYEIDAKIANYKQQLEQITGIITDSEKSEIVRLAQEIARKENLLRELVQVKNQLEELKNQQRHLLKRRDAYDLAEFESLLKKGIPGDDNSERIKRRLDRLAEALVKMSESKRIGFIKRILLYLNWRMPLSSLDSTGIIIQSLVEEKYLASEIEAIEKKLEKEDLNRLQNEISEAYKNEYVLLSKKFILGKLKEQHCNHKFCNTIKKLLESDLSTKIKKNKKELIDLYPVILTTVDAAISNFYSFFRNGARIDCVIIDEASQCDILAALPLLYLAKQVVIVGDNKQLSAIVDLPTEVINIKVHEHYDYTKMSFLSTIARTIRPSSNMLLEHYRCDYKIINYCNRYYYDNKLIIFNGAEDNSMCIVDDDKGVYLEIENGSFLNKREIETIDDMICSNVDGKFVITPFKAQAKKLKDRYNEKQCGTIHTFQGKGEDMVCFCTVLNNDKNAIKHLKGKNNLFSNELINVAVSRAKNKFVLVTDVKFFKENDENIKNLIEYIEAYGEVIPDKTVCIFDYLYQQMKAYTVVEDCDNIFEKKVKELIDKYIKLHQEYSVVVKLPLANVVTDKLFLRNNLEIKQYILNNAHLDFTIYDNRIDKPLAVIELDGKYHEMEEQKQRDIKKNTALKHMEIELWRLKSKDALSEEQFNIKLGALLRTKT